MRARICTYNLHLQISIYICTHIHVYVFSRTFALFWIVVAVIVAATSLAHLRHLTSKLHKSYDNKHAAVLANVRLTFHKPAALLQWPGYGLLPSVASVFASIEKHLRDRSSARQVADIEDQRTKELQQHSAEEAAISRKSGDDRAGDGPQEPMYD